MINEIESLEEIRAKAWTFQGLNPPEGAVKIAEEIRRGEKRWYYKTRDGKYYYETENGKKWKNKIEKWAKERQKKKH